MGTARRGPGRRGTCDSDGPGHPAEVTEPGVLLPGVPAGVSEPTEISIPLRSGGQESETKVSAGLRSL